MVANKYKKNCVLHVNVLDKFFLLIAFIALVPNVLAQENSAKPSFKDMQKISADNKANQSEGSRLFNRPQQGEFFKLLFGIAFIENENVSDAISDYDKPIKEYFSRVFPYVGFVWNKHESDSHHRIDFSSLFLNYNYRRNSESAGIWSVRLSSNFVANFIDGSEYEDPYEVEQPRSKTFRLNNQVSVRYLSGKRHAAIINYTLKQNRYNKDITPTRDPLLGRDALVHNIGLGYSFGLGVIQYVYSLGIAKGKADSYTADGYLVSLIIPTPKIQIITNYESHYNIYNEVNPEVSYTQKMREIALRFIMRIPSKPINYDITYIYHSKDNNINIFDTKSNLFLIGGSYDF